MNSRIIRFFVFAITSCFISCSPGYESIYDSNYPLTTQRVKSLSGEISVRIPEEWFSVTDNEKQSFDLWLIKNDYSAAISFVKLNPDEQTLQHKKDDRLSLLLKYSKMLKRAENGNDFSVISDDEFFELNNLRFGSFVFSAKDFPKNRIIIFEFGNNFYESTATILNSTDNNDFELFEIQNTVLKSIY